MKKKYKMRNRAHCPVSKHFFHRIESSSRFIVHNLECCSFLVNITKHESVFTHPSTLPQGAFFSPLYLYLRILVAEIFDDTEIERTEPKWWWELVGHKLMLWLNEEITTFAHNLVQHLLWTTTSILTWTTLNVGHIFRATVICVCVCVCVVMFIYTVHTSTYWRNSIAPINDRTTHLNIKFVSLLMHKRCCNIERVLPSNTGNHYQIW